MKIITLVSILGISAIAIACASFGSDNSNSNDTVATKAFKQEYPQVFANVGYSKLVESSPLSTNNLSESAIQSQGKSTNPFGIRDDIFAYIVKNIPKGNESAMYAAIRQEQYEQLIYTATNESDALHYARKSFVPIVCLDNVIGIQKAHQFSTKIDDIRISTPAGVVADIRVRKLLGWKVIGPDISFEEIDQICKSGEY